MLYYALVSLSMAALSGVVGFGHFVDDGSWATKVLCGVFLAVFIVLLAVHTRRWSCQPVMCRSRLERRKGVGTEKDAPDA